MIKNKWIKNTWIKNTCKVMAAILVVIITGFISHAAVSETVQGNAEKSSRIIVDAFRSTGAYFRKMDIQGWVQLNDRYITQNEMHHTLNLVITKLGIDTKKFKTQTQNHDNFLSITRSGWFDQQTYLTAIIQTVRGDGGQNKGETYLIVGFSHFGTPKNHSLLRTKIMDAFSPVQAEAKYSTVISGTVPKKIDAAEMQELTNKVMGKAGAEIVENYADGRMVSVTGYTPGIADRLTPGEKRVNINMAVRYNSEDNNTYIYIGSPIITTEY